MKLDRGSREYGRRGTVSKGGQAYSIGLDAEYSLKAYSNELSSARTTKTQ